MRPYATEEERQKAAKAAYERAKNKSFEKRKSARQEYTVEVWFKASQKAIHGRKKT